MPTSSASTSPCPHCEAPLDHLGRGCGACGQRVPWSWTEPCWVCDEDADYTRSCCPHCRVRLPIWDGIVARVLKERHHADLRIDKDAVPHPLDAGFVRHTGDPRGQHADYRRPLPDGRGVHVKEYRDSFAIHWDKVDPLESWFGHIVADAPHWFLVGGFLAFKFGRYSRLAASFIKR